MIHCSGIATLEDVRRKRDAAVREDFRAEVITLEEARVAWERNEWPVDYAADVNRTKGNFWDITAVGDKRFVDPLQPISATMDELEITKRLVTIIESDDGLRGTIMGTDAINMIVAALDDPNIIPEFSVDYLLRAKAARAAQRALGVLSMLEIVSVDKSISGVVSEILRPDIVAYNPEAGAFVLIEVKKDTKTEREAITELAAYEQELRNHFPMMSKLDIVHIVVSTEWSTLLEHAISGMIMWEGKTCLGLDLTVDGDSIALNVHLPSAWRSLWSHRLPPNALTTIELCPCDQTSQGGRDGQGDGHLLRLMQSAFDLIVRHGERTGSHGFALLWRDYLAVSQSTYIITVGVVDPRAFLRASITNDVWTRDNNLHQFFWDNEGDWTEHGVHTEGLIDLTRSARKLLAEIGRPCLEGFWTWETEHYQLQSRAEPLVMGFWGALGEFHEELTLNQSVRTVYAPHLSHGAMYIHDARWGVMFLNTLALGRAFASGRITCSLCYMLGVWCQRLALIDRLIVDENENVVPLRIMKHWHQLSLAEFIADIGVWLQSVDDITIQPPTITFGRIWDHSDDRNQMNALASWLHQVFIGEPFVFHQRLFENGLDTSACVDMVLREWLTKDEALECKQRLSTLARDYLKAGIGEYVNCVDAGTLSDTARACFVILLEKYEQPVTDDPTFDELIEYARDHDAWLSAVPDFLLAETFVPYVLPFLDEVVEDVQHSVRHATPNTPDWDFLQQETNRLRDEGHQFPAVVLDQSNMLSLAIINSPAGDVSDPEHSVLLLIQYPSAKVIKAVRWEELKDGTAFTKNS